MTVGRRGSTKSQDNSATKLVVQPAAQKESRIREMKKGLLAVHWSQRACLRHFGVSSDNEIVRG